MPRKQLTKPICYLASSPSINVRPLHKVLLKKGVEIKNAAELIAGKSILEGIHGNIRESDFVIGVLGTTQTDANVYFELGIAYGLRKRILIFATDKNENLPFDFGHHFTIRSELSNSEAVEFAIEQILEAPPKKSVKKPKSNSKVLSKSIGKKADSFLLRLKNLNDSNFDYDFSLEYFVNELLNDCGVEVVSQAPVAKKMVDFAVWSDELEPTIGNPLLIEVKQNLIRKSDFVRTVTQIHNLMIQTGGLYGLVLYQKGINREDIINTKLPNTVITIRLDDFINLLRDHSFAEVILKQRNSLSHESIS